MNDNRNKMKKIVKKGAVLTLSAVLLGGVAAGTYEGMSHFAGWDSAQAVQAAEERVTLTKTKAKEDSAETEETKAAEETEAAEETSEAPTGSLDVSDIAAEVMPSIVSITTVSVTEVQDYYGMFFGYESMPEEWEQEGSGSGIIVGENDTELLIATNYHVIEGADTVSVGFIDENVYEAKVKGYDASKDLAVVAVALDDLDDETRDAISVIKVGDSDELAVGQQVVAIGNALGYGQSVTTGIVSAKNRRMDSNSGAFQTGDSADSQNGINLIQTDAAINPGNSGGALLNMDGELVGINSAKLASTEVEGMGYAIAITDVADILENLMNEEAREQLEDSDHGVLGIMASTVSDEGIQVYGFPQGVYVSEVNEGGAAEEAGLPAKSIITGFNGKTVTNIDQLLDMLTDYAPGEEVELTVQVPDGSSYKEETVTVTLDENTEAQETEEASGDSQSEEAAPEEEEGRTSLFRDWEEGAQPQMFIR